MTPQEIGQWIATHGGPDGGEGPDSHGVIVNRAKDGSTLTVRQTTQGDPSDYTEVSRNETGQASAAPPAAIAPSSTSAGGTGVDQQQVLAGLAAIAPGGDQSKLKYVETTRKATVTDNSGLTPKTVTKDVPVRIWYDPTTGQALKYDLNDDGTFTQTFSGIDKALRQAAAASRTPAEQAADANATELQQQREKNAALPKDQDPAYETDKERKDRGDAVIRQQGIDARAAETTARANATQDRNDRRLDDAEARAAAQGSRIVVNNQLYEKGADGKWAPVTPKPAEIIKGGGPGGVDVQAVYDPAKGTYSYQPITGAVAEAPGPDMPTIVAGQTEQALIQYHDALAKDPTQSPQQRKDRFAEFVQIANAGVTDAQNRQHDAESSRNAQVTVASNRLTFLQNGLDSALKFVLDFNDKLPQGSDAGAKAFAAIMSINMLQLGMSGINDINTGRLIVPPVLPAGTPPPPTIANPANPSDVNKAREEVAAHPANPSSPAAQASTQSVQAPSTPTVPSSPPSPATQGGPPPPLGQGQDISSPTGGTAPPTPGEPGGPPLQTTYPPLSTAPPDGPVYVGTFDGGQTTYTPDGKVWQPGQNGLPVQIGTWDPSMGQPPGTGPSPQDRVDRPTPDTTPPARTPQPGDQLNGLPPGQSVLPDPNAAPPAPPTPPFGSNDLTMTPPPDMGILAQYQQQPSQSVQPSGASDFGPDPADHPAVLHSMARTLPPWRISEEQYRKMRAAGVSDEQIAQVPSGQGVAA